MQRCETRYREEWQERVDGYRVTYKYHGRGQVTEMPYRPGERIRVRVDVTPGGMRERVVCHRSVGGHLEDGRPHRLSGATR